LPAADFFAELDLLAEVDFFAVDFAAVDFFAADDLDFAAVGLDLDAVDFFAVLAFDLLAVDFFAVADFDFAAVDFFALLAFDLEAAVDFFAPVDFDFEALDFAAPPFFPAVDFFADVADLRPDVDFFAEEPPEDFFPPLDLLPPFLPAEALFIAEDSSFISFSAIMFFLLAFGKSVGTRSVNRKSDQEVG
jgi:hypothetical protein